MNPNVKLCGRLNLLKQGCSIQEALKIGCDVLKSAGNEEAALDASYLLEAALGMKKASFYLFSDKKFTFEEAACYVDYLERRIQGEPVQYILGIWEFMGYPFYVSSGVLIPRQDTETLIETILRVHQKDKIHRALDIGTGTGCIPISLVLSGIDFCFGIDISTKALALAKKNAEYNQASDRVTWIQSNLFQNIPFELIGSMDAVVSNPPYIPRKEIETLMTEVREYEPHLALDGGEDGLDFYKRISAEAGQYLKAGGYLFYEIGYNQAEAVEKILQNAGFIDIVVEKDLAGLDRVVWARKRL